MISNNEELAQALEAMGYMYRALARPGAELALPIYRPNRYVLPHHLISVGITLDATWLMDRADFDDFVAATSLKQSAS